MGGLAGHAVVHVGTGLGSRILDLCLSGSCLLRELCVCVGKNGFAQEPVQTQVSFQTLWEEAQVQ